MMAAGPSAKRPPHISFLAIGAARMPRLSFKVPYAKPLAVVGGAIALGALLGVLYVILSGPVQPLDRVPAALAQLKPEKAPKTAPDVAFSDATGKRHLLSEFRGRYVLVNLWATWCGPCVRELPALARLQVAIPDKRLQVVAVNVGRSDAKKTADYLKVNHAGALGVWLDTAVALIRAFDAYGLPTSMLIDPEGREVARAIGASNWDAPSAIAYFNALPMPKPKGAAGRPAS